MRIRILSLLFDRKYEYFINTSSSVLLKNIIEDIASFSQQIFLPLLDVSARLLLVLMLSFAVLMLEPVVLIVAIILVGIFFVAVIMPIRRRASVTSDSIQVQIRRLYFEVHQALTGIKPILATGRGGYFIDRCEGASMAVSREMPRIPLYGGIPRSALEILVFGGLIVWVLAAIAGGGSALAIMPRVGLIAVIAYRLMPSLQLIFSQAMMIASTRQSMQELLHIFREQSRASAASDSGVSGGRAIVPARLEWNEAIRFDNVTFSYAGSDRAALKNISLTIAKGERVAFVGSTGSGKSTLIDLILGLLQPSEGRILVDEQALTSNRLPAWRKAVGYVPQDLFLLDATIAENVAFGLHRNELDLERVVAVCDQSQARGFIERQRQGGFWSQVGERGFQMSGGQRQRLAVARALYGQPSVLVMDEATSALDPNTEEKVLASLARMEQSITVITVTHRLGTVKNCDRIYFMDHGQIVASGTYEDLAATHLAFQRFTQ